MGANWMEDVRDNLVAGAQCISHAFTVGTSPTVLSTQLSTVNARRRLFITNPNTIVAYVGDANVTTAIGFPIDYLGTLELPIGKGSPVYLRAGSVTTVRVLELG